MSAHLSLPSTFPSPPASSSLCFSFPFLFPRGVVFGGGLWPFALTKDEITDQYSTVAQSSFWFLLLPNMIGFLIFTCVCVWCLKCACIFVSLPFFSFACHCSCRRNLRGWRISGTFFLIHTSHVVFPPVATVVTSFFCTVFLRTAAVNGSVVDPVCHQAVSLSLWCDCNSRSCTLEQIMSH